MFFEGSHARWNAISAATALIGLAFLGAATPQNAHAQTDITYGGDARYFAMGGAGIALLQERSGSRINPASIAYESQPYALLYPTLGLRAAGGASTGNVTNFLLNGQKLDDARDIAVSFGKQDSDFGINGNVGLRVGKIEVSGSAVARGRILPNAVFSSWSNGDKTQQIPPGSQVDVFAGGYYVLPAIAGATTLPAKSDAVRSYAVGGRLKYMRGIYTHDTVNSLALINGGKASPAPELNGKDHITKNGIGLDLGFLARPRKPQAHASYAAVIANAIKPKFDINGTDRDGNFKKYKLLATTISTGMAYQKNNTTFAADLVDITSSAGKAQLRFGAEQKLISNLYLRGGYNSSNGFVYGVGLLGFDIAVGKRQSLELVKTLNF